MDAQPSSEFGREAAAGDGAPAMNARRAGERVREDAAVRRSAAYRLLAADPRNELHAVGTPRKGTCYLSLVVGGRPTMRRIAWRTSVKLIIGGWVEKVAGG